jgi:hypothetical protein
VCVPLCACCVAQDKCPKLIENEPPVKKCRSAEDCADHQECVFTVGDCGPLVTTTDPLAKADADSSSEAAAAAPDPDAADAGAESGLRRPPWSVVTGVCKARIFCIRSEPFCSCSGQSYCACRADRPTRSRGACKGQHPNCKWVKSAEEDRTAADAVAAADEAAADEAAADPAPDAASDSSAATDAPASMLTHARALTAPPSRARALTSLCAALCCPVHAVAEQRRNGLGACARVVSCVVSYCVPPLSAFASLPLLFTASTPSLSPRSERALRSFALRRCL